MDIFGFMGGGEIFFASFCVIFKMCVCVKVVLGHLSLRDEEPGGPYFVMN